MLLIEFGNFTHEFLFAYLLMEFTLLKANHTRKVIPNLSDYKLCMIYLPITLPFTAKEHRRAKMMSVIFLAYKTILLMIFELRLSMRIKSIRRIYIGIILFEL